MASKAFRVNDNRIVKGSNKANKTIINLSKNNKPKNLIYIPNIRAMKKPIFLICNTKKTFNYLKQIFIKAPIFQHFNLKSHIQNEIDTLS